MGIIRREVRFGAESEEQWVTAPTLIDTGATHCQISDATARELHARLFRTSPLVLADGSVQQRQIVYVRVQVDPSLPAVLTTAMVGPDNAPYLVGAVALEQLGLGVHPSTQQLAPDMPVLLRSTNWATV